MKDNYTDYLISLRNDLGDDFEFEDNTNEIVSEYQGDLQIINELWKITNKPFNKEIIFNLYNELINSFKEGELI